jgi:tetratricopeptide (TPR) repeat protein
MYINSNHAAWMFAACAVLGLALTIRRNLHTEARLLTGGLSAAALFGLILTISRGGYLAAGAGLSVVLVGSLLSLRVRSVDRFVRMGLSALLALALVGVAVFYALKSNAWHDERWARLAEGLAVNARLPIWESAIEQFKLSPAFGTGARTFYYYGRRLRVEGGTQTDHVWAHNDYLDLLAGYGVIGIGLLAVVIAVHLWQPVRSFYRAGERAAGPSVMCSNSSALMLGALAIAAVNLVHSVVDFNMHIPANALIMCWALGILANPGVRPAPMRTPPRGWLHAPALVAVPVVGFLLIGIAGLYYRPEYFNEKARVAQRDGRYDQELAYAEEGLKYDAANPVLYRHAGSGRFHNASVIRDPMVRRTQDFEAARSLEAALALFPYDYETWLHYARALDRGMRPVEAERAYLKAIEENPRLAQAHAAYANFLWRGARWQDAIERMLLARRYRIPLSD